MQPLGEENASGARSNTSGSSANSVIIAYPLPVAAAMSPEKHHSKCSEGHLQRHRGKTCRVCKTNEASLNWNGEDRPVLI